MDKLIITAALTGAEVTRDQQPALPITPQEIGIAAAECAAAGASIVHVHARHADGSPTQDSAIYQRIIEEVRSRCDVIVQVSTGGAVGMTPAERLAPVSLNPEMATLSMGSVNFGGDVFLNHPSDIEMFAKEMMARGVKPELEIFDSGMLATAKRWLAKGKLPTPAHFDLVMGVPGGMAGNAQTLLYMLGELPPGATWTVTGIGAAQLPMTTLAILLGGHVRVGFEDNIYYRKGELARSNAEFVDRVVRLARELQREVATAEEARGILGMRTAALPVMPLVSTPAMQRLPSK
jgi:3-keto-5-aminohexanoate cleavage enzyme